MVEALDAYLADRMLRVLMLSGLMYWAVANFAVAVMVGLRARR
jgi:hypothetical protein